jgi:hypothetical protein
MDFYLFMPIYDIFNDAVNGFDCAVLATPWS